MNSEEQRLRVNRCCCFSAFKKRKSLSRIRCVCSARLILARLLSDRAVSIQPITERYIRENWPLLDRHLLEIYRAEEVIYNREGFIRKSKKSYQRFLSEENRRREELAREVANPRPELEAREEERLDEEVEIKRIKVEQEDLEDLVKESEHKLKDIAFVHLNIKTELIEEDKVTLIKEEVESDLSLSIMDKWASAVADVAQKVADNCQSDEFSKVFADFLTTYEYKGFDVQKIRTTFVKRMADMKPGEVVYIGTTKIDLTDPGNSNTIICYLVSLFNLRGTNIENITEGLEGNTKVTFRSFCNNLGLQSRVSVSGKAKSAETLTLGRIAAAFPIHAVTIATDEKMDRKVISMSDIGLKNDPLSKALMHPMAASILTEEMVKEGIVFITFLAAYRLNNLIGGSNKAKPDRLWLFHQASLKSKAAELKQRKSLWARVLYAPKDEAMLASIKLAKEEVAKVVDDGILEEINNFKL